LKLIEEREHNVRRKKISYAHVWVGFLFGAAADVLFAAPWQKPNVDWSALISSSLEAGIAGAFIALLAVWLTNKRLAARTNS
jgi:hypothetical protein